MIGPARPIEEPRLVRRKGKWWVRRCGAHPADHRSPRSRPDSRRRTRPPRRRSSPSASRSCGVRCARRAGAPARSPVYGQQHLRRVQFRPIWDDIAVGDSRSLPLPPPSPPAATRSRGWSLSNCLDDILVVEGARHAVDLCIGQAVPGGDVAPGQDRHPDLGGNAPGRTGLETELAGHRKSGSIELASSASSSVRAWFLGFTSTGIGLRS